MTTPTVTRTAFLAGLAGFGAIAVAMPASAARDAAAETYVQQNASEAFRILGDRNVTPEQRQQTFNTLIRQFSDMDYIAVWVVGRYSVQLRADPTLRQQWIDAFKNFAVATYEDQLGAYNGAAVHVTGSNLHANDIIVSTDITPRGQRAQQVQWRLRRSGNVWRVLDISLTFEGGNQLWAAQQQQLDFLAFLDAHHGDIRALIAHINQVTETLRRHNASR